MRQRDERLQPEYVERDGGQAQDAIAAVQLRCANDRMNEIVHLPVLNHDALRIASGPGRVEDIG
ncbi:hypothetical protein D3C73_1601390 [compost metagenome]